VTFVGRDADVMGQRSRRRTVAPIILSFNSRVLNKSFTSLLFAFVLTLINIISFSSSDKEAGLREPGDHELSDILYFFIWICHLRKLPFIASMAREDDFEDTLWRVGERRVKRTTHL